MEKPDARTRTGGSGHYAALESRLAAVLARYDSRPDTNGVQFALASPSRDWSWTWSPQSAVKQYFIASTTKLYVTSLIMQLRSEGRLDIDAPAAASLAPGVMDGINVLKGVDYGPRITVRELLGHTSGIADYFERERKDGTTTIARALQEDAGWTFEDVLRITKEELSPAFPPSAAGKARYSDTNYQLLGAIVEHVDGIAYEDSLRQRILEPLGLPDTWPFTGQALDRYGTVAAMLYGTKPVSIPLAMASVRADGGIVSTATDGITFLQAFMTGGLFPAAYLAEMQQAWRKIFPPLEYGLGVMRFALPRYYTMFRRVPPMVGHSGASGAVLFCVPEMDLYVSGTVNQIEKRSLSFNLMARLVMACQAAFAE